MKNTETPKIFEFEPIGYIRSTVRYTQEAPRQGVLTSQSGIIRLEKKRNFEAALADLDGIQMIWIIFVFDRVRNWKPKVCPPLGGMDRKIGVFATRSPHRPNPIGITAAKLTAVKGLSLYVEGIDLLDGTPVLDIKPYIPMADSFPDAGIGWREGIEPAVQQLFFSEDAELKLAFLSQNGGPDVKEFCRTQLSTRDLDGRRLRLTGPDEQGRYLLAFRTWRIVFTRNETAVQVENVFSGYTQSELEPGAEDPYEDKDLHREFVAVFCNKS